MESSFCSALTLLLLDALLVEQGMFSPSSLSIEGVSLGRVLTADELLDLFVLLLFLTLLLKSLSVASLGVAVVDLVVRGVGLKLFPLQMEGVSWRRGD